MIIDDLSADQAVLDEIGRRVAAVRVARQLTQARLAFEAGVSKRTVERLENGHSVQLDNFIRCLRALGLLSALQALVPDAADNPLLLLRRQGQVRRRVRTVLREPVEKGEWTWGDEP